jgi:hypothetical protein
VAPWLPSGVAGSASDRACPCGAPYCFTDHRCQHHAWAARSRERDFPSVQRVSSGCSGGTLSPRVLMRSGSGAKKAPNNQKRDTLSESEIHVDSALPPWSRTTWTPEELKSTWPYLTASQVCSQQAVRDVCHQPGAAGRHRHNADALVRYSFSRTRLACSTQMGRAGSEETS